MSKPPPFDLAPSETVVHVTPAALLRGITATTGRIWLTNQQFVFHPAVPWVMWIVPLVGLVMWAMNRSHWIRLPLVDIRSRERTSFGRNHNVLRLETTTGEHKLVIDAYGDFDAALAGQLQRAA